MKDPFTEKQIVDRHEKDYPRYDYYLNLRGACGDNSYPSQFSSSERWGYPPEEFDYFIGFRIVRNR